MYCSTYYTTTLCIVFKDYYIKQQPTKSGLMLCGAYVVRVRLILQTPDAKLLHYIVILILLPRLSTVQINTKALKLDAHVSQLESSEIVISVRIFVPTNII